MVGLGRGRWIRQDRKICVEDCQTVNVNRLARMKLLRPGTAGTLEWRDLWTKQVTATVGYSVVPTDSQGLRLILRYTVADAEAMTIPVDLEATRQHLGGVRLWFRCPLVISRVPCRRRVAKLHLRDGLFGCRHCHELTHRSCQPCEHFDLAIGQNEAGFRLTTREWRRVVLRQARLRGSN